MADVDT